eukprot:SAG22_NODE_22075_length_251_cov_1.684211_1_plen_46_part_10
MRTFFRSIWCSGGVRNAQQWPTVLQLRVLCKLTQYPYYTIPLVQRV